MLLFVLQETLSAPSTLLFPGPASPPPTYLISDLSPRTLARLGHCSGSETTVPLCVASCKKPISVSLVEPHEIARNHLKQILSREPRLRITEANPPEASVSGKSIPRVFVLSHLPTSRLFRYLRMIRGMNNYAKILVVESTLRPAMAVSLLRSGVQGFVMDEEVDQDLLSAVRTVLEDRVWIRSKYVSYDKWSGLSPESAALAMNNTFTPRQRRVVDLVRERLSNKEIAAELGISERTVKFHLQNVFSSLGVNSRRAIEDLAPPPTRPKVQPDGNPRLP